MGNQKISKSSKSSKCRQMAFEQQQYEKQQSILIENYECQKIFELRQNTPSSIKKYIEDLIDIYGQGFFIQKVCGINNRYGKSVSIPLQKLEQIFSCMEEIRYNSLYVQNEGILLQTVQHVNFSRLKILNLHDCRFTNIQGLAFLNIPEVQKLELGQNDIHSLQPLAKMNTKKLNIIWIKLRNINPNQFKYLQRSNCPLLIKIVAHFETNQLGISLLYQQLIKINVQSRKTFNLLHKGQYAHRIKSLSKCIF